MKLNMKPQEEKPATFDDYAGDYAALIHDPIREKFAAGSRFFFERKIQIIRGFFERTGIDMQGVSWLDIGCGQGDLLRLGRQYFKSTAGCDPSQGMLKSCQDLDVHHQHSMESLPFADASFDFITAVCVYHHVPEERRPLLTAEALRVLKPRGVFCIIEQTPRNPVTRLIVSRTPVDADARLLTANETGRLLSSAGSKVIQTEYFLLFPERLHRFTRPLEDVLRPLPFGGQYAVFARGAPSALATG
jgi:ubiquinone/menaquinone biosynthesis C-methylase UbiE